MKAEWVPMLGFGRGALEPGSDAAVDVARSLEVVRRSVCAYNTPAQGRDVRCDCKYGLGDHLDEGVNVRGEKTGCPELRVTINWLLGETEEL